MSDVYVASGRIEIDAQGAIDAFNKVNNSAKEAEKGLGHTSSKFANFGEKANNFGKKLTLGATTPILALGTASFKAASDINESLSKSEVVFGSNAEAIKQWSKTATEAFGASQNEALEMVSKYGAMGKAMGLSSDQVKDYSMNMTQLAGDLASFNNISVDMANTALTGVYTGETEALKGLGIVMTQVNLQRFAESQGIHKKIKDMNQAEQVQLRYNYVMAQTKDAQGDYKRTASSASNTIKTFRKSLANLSASFGQFLLCLTPAINYLNKLVNKFNGLSDGTKKTILIIAALVAGIGPLLIMIAKVVTSINTIKNAVKGFTLAQKALNLVLAANPIGIVITLLVALGVVFVQLYAKCEWFRDGVNNFFGSILELFKSFSNFLKGAFTTDWTQAFGAFGNVLNAFFRNVANVWSSVKRIFNGIITFIKGVFTGKLIAPL